jgi:hypothetical protein
MYFGGSIFLIAVGAVLAFAVQDAISGVDLVQVGYILMGAGALGIVLTLIMSGQRRERTVVERRDPPPPPA